MIQNLLTEVIKASGIDVHTRGDCELLSALILVETDMFVSYNTLRRLFGLAEGGKPRQQTLDVLSKFCGYDGYRNFCVDQPKLSLWKQREELYLLLSLGDAPSAISFFEGVDNDLVKLELLVTVFRESYVSNQDDFIISLLNAGCYELDRHAYTYQIHTAIALGLIIRKHPLENRIPLLSNPHFVESIYLRLIDYSALNGYYGEWTHLLQNQPISVECQIFIACLERLKSFLNQTTIPNWNWAELPRQELHPALKGRIFTVQLLENESPSYDDLWKSTFGGIDETYFELSAFIEPSTFALATGHRELATWLIQKVQINESALQQFQLHDLHVHFLMQAMCALFDDRLRDAQFWMSRFDENELRRPCFYDFLLFPVRRLQAELNDDAFIYPTEVREMAVKLGHPWFSEDLWNSFFTPSRIPIKAPGPNDSPH